MEYFLNRKFIERFRARLDTASVPGCHIWTGHTVGGYGKVRTPRMRSAHAVALEIHLGRRLGPGKGTHGNRLQANHRDDLCKRKDCCNPAHMYEGTQRENMLDSRAKHPRPAITHCKLGHPREPGLRFCRVCQLASQHRSVERRLAGLIQPNTRGRKPFAPCTHAHAFDYVDNRGSTICRECQNIRRRSKARARVSLENAAQS